MSKYIWVILCTLVLVIMPVSLIGCNSGGSSTLSPADQESIYAAVVRRLATVDDTFGGTLKPSRLFIIRNTDDKAGDPSEKDSQSTAIPPASQEKITGMLNDLSADIVWIDEFADAEFEESPPAGLENLSMQVIKAGGAIFTLGNAYLQKDGSVRVAGSIYVDNLATGGATYVLVKKDGVWAITGTIGARWIS
jgi:hypothetical protein